MSACIWMHGLFFGKLYIEFKWGNGQICVELRPYRTGGLQQYQETCEPGTQNTDPNRFEICKKSVSRKFMYDNVIHKKLHNLIVAPRSVVSPRRSSQEGTWHGEGSGRINRLAEHGYTALSADKSSVKHVHMTVTRIITQPPCWFVELRSHQWAKILQLQPAMLQNCLYRDLPPPTLRDTPLWPF